MVNHDDLCSVYMYVILVGVILRSMRIFVGYLLIVNNQLALSRRGRKRSVQGAIPSGSREYDFFGSAFFLLSSSQFILYYVYIVVY